jgi:hypothetical protein
MAFWNSSTGINSVYRVSPDDGLGDTIYDAFGKVNSNFANISAQLAQTTQDWLNANVEFQFNAASANIGNVGVSGIITSNTINSNYLNLANDLDVTGNIGVDGFITVDGNATIAGSTNVVGNLYTSGTTIVHGDIIPAANLTYNLGGPSLYFNNIYTRGLIQVNTVSASSDAGLLQLHANLSPGDIKDVGIFGKFYQNSSNSFAFFGHQQATNNFVYKITPTDVTLGNSIVYDGFYGNTQFGSTFLSNTTASTNTATGALIVAGGAGIAGALNVGANITAPSLVGNVYSTVANIGRMSVSGNVSGTLNVDGNIYANGGTVLTTTTLGLGTLFTTASSIGSGPWVYTNGTQSTSIGTGAVVLSFGGLGVAGNINAGGNVTATNFVGTFGGTINNQNTTSANITAANLTVTNSFSVTSVQATSVGATTITATNLNGLASLSLTGNLNAGNINATTGHYGNHYGTFYGSGANLTNLPVVAAAAGTLTGTTLASGVTASSLTSVGTLTGLTINSSTTAITNGGTNGTGNIGATGATFNTVFAKATTALYADLAEKYLADRDYPIGTVVAVGGTSEVTACKFGDLAIGAVSHSPAYMMNSELVGGTYIALKGRVPVQVIGAVVKGQRLIAGDNGCAQAASNSLDTFAISLETNSNAEIKLVEAIIL